MSIVDIAVGDKRFSTLVSLLKKANLVSELQKNGPFTVFAPTDDAFKELLNTLDESTKKKLEQKEFLKSVLLYHVIPSKVLASDVVNTLKNGIVFTPKTASGKNLCIYMNRMSPMISGARLIQTDIKASNGVIHVIDKVMLPMDTCQRM